MGTRYGAGTRYGTGTGTRYGTDRESRYGTGMGTRYGTGRGTRYEQAWKLNMKQAWELGVEQAQERDMEQDIDITEEDEKIQRLSDLLKEISADKFMLSQFLKQTDISFEKVTTSMPKSDNKRDTRYSLEVWIPADGMKLFHNLNIAEKKILKSKQWLNDIIIDSSMDLLQYQFPDLEGFHSCQLVYQLDFERHSKLFIQIINRSPQDGGSHWLTVSNINCLENTIKVYDSAYDDLAHEEEMVVASLVSTNANNLQVLFPNIALQTNGYDCGLYAIANATAFAYGMDPGTQVYIPKLMREHLFKCLEQKHLEPFPITNIKNRRKTLKNAVDVPLYCLCHMPDTRTIWAASSEFGTYRLCEQRRFRRACASAQSRQNFRCSLIQAVSQEEPSDRKPDPWSL